MCAVGLLSACAAPPQSTPAGNSSTVSAKNNAVECHTERLTGSMIPTPVCTTQADRAKVDANTQQVRQDMEMLKPVCTKANGC